MFILFLYVILNNYYRIQQFFMFFQNSQLQYSHLLENKEFLSLEKDNAKLKDVLETVDLFLYAGFYKIVGNKYSLNFLLKNLRNLDELETESLSFKEINKTGDAVMQFFYGNLKSAVITEGASYHRIPNKVFNDILTYSMGICLLSIYDDISELDDVESFEKYIISKFNEKYYSNPSIRLNKIIQTLNINFEAHESFTIGSSEFGVLLSKLKSIFLSRIFWIISLIIILISFLYIKISNNSIDENIKTQKGLDYQKIEKLKDSLNEIKIQTEILNNDSLQTFRLDDSHTIDLAKSSSLINILEYLNDSTRNDTLEIRVFELRFANKNDEIFEINKDYIKNLYRILYYNPNSLIYIKAYSDLGMASADRRAMFLKNRLIGEGVSVKRIFLDSNFSNQINPAYALNSQVHFRITK